MKRSVILLSIVLIASVSLGLSSCSQHIISSHENDYIYSSNPPFTPVSKIPPGSLLSQQVGH